jgi:hypothetical protein
MTEPDILTNEMVRDTTRDKVIDQECKGGSIFFRRSMEGKSSRSS